MDNRLKVCRTSRNLTQEEVAKELGISRSAYSHYEVGLRDIPIDVIMRLADYYKCTTDELLGSWYYYEVLSRGNKNA